MLRCFIQAGSLFCCIIKALIGACVNGLCMGACLDLFNFEYGVSMSWLVLMTLTK